MTKNGTKNVIYRRSAAKGNIEMILPFSPETLRFDKTPTSTVFQKGAITASLHRMRLAGTIALSCIICFILTLQ
jgi:hypothetical protein